MITKAIVEEIISPYKIKIRIPIYNGSGDSKNSTVSDRLSTAIINTLPNISNHVEIGDIVIIGFEDRDISKPIILGQLYKENMNTKINADLCQLTTISTTKLAKDTTIGDVSSQNIACLQGAKYNIQQKLDELSNYINYSTSETLIGQWIDDEKLYRKVFNYFGNLPTNSELLLGNIGANISSVIDIKQTATFNGSAYDMYYNSTSGDHTIIGCRVDLSTGNVYAMSCNDSWENTHLIVIVEYTK